MKYYKSYMNRQEISPAVHENLLNLETSVRHYRPWLRYGALAACAALIIGVGMWKLAPAPAITPDPPQSAGQFAADYAPLPGEKDVVEPDDLFVVSSPAEGGKLMLPMLPGINYQDITDRPEMDACRVYMPGSFMVDLEKDDIQTIFWGPEGKPEASHPKMEQGDLPWMLFWDGYTLRGRALYDGQGQLMELTIWGEKDKADFELELCLGALPFTCCIDTNRGDEISEFNGVEVAGWSRRTECGSEFMTKNNIGVRFVNRIEVTLSDLGLSEDEAEHMNQNEFKALYEEAVNMRQDGLRTFNTLFVRQALVNDGGLYLDHLAVNENIPAWRKESFSTLAQARQEIDFAPYLPTSEPEGYGAYTGNKEFYGNLSYQEGRENRLFVRWSRGYDDVEVCVYRDGYHSYNLADPSNPASYDLRLYTIPWYDSVPEEYRETVDYPAFRAEDMSPAIVEARGVEKDTGGLSFDFDVLHPDGTVVSYRCDGLTAAQVWDMVQETL